MTKPVNVYLLGSGIRGTIQLTRETEQAMRACSSLFVLHDDADVLEHARRLCVDVRDMAEVYTDGAVRAEVYRAIADALIERASTDDTVGLLVHGHPLFLVSAAEYALEQAGKAGLRSRVLPAVSSFDTLLCDLGVDYGYGLQLFDATTMLQRGWRPDPAIPLLVFQLATILEGRVVTEEPGPEALRPLADALREVYEPDRPCVMLRSAAHVLEAPQREDVRLAELDTTPTVPLWERPTLYVPADDA